MERDNVVANVCAVVDSSLEWVRVIRLPVRFINKSMSAISTELFFRSFATLDKTTCCFASRIEVNSNIFRCVVKIFEQFN